jgi:site-specific DNA recombinase
MSRSPAHLARGAGAGRAQFERELIGERVRDKIAASKRKGIWVGGPVPLGYTAIDKKVVAVPAEAAAVRTIFERYLELGSVRALAEDLDHLGIRSKARQLSNGRTIGGGCFGVGALAYLLKNRFYIGEVVYRGEVLGGEHEPILDRALFEAVQAKLAAQAVERRCRLRGSCALLTGRSSLRHCAITCRRTAPRRSRFPIMSGS